MLDALAGGERDLKERQIDLSSNLLNSNLGEGYLSEYDELYRIVKMLTMGLKYNVLELDKAWKLYASLQVKRCRLEYETEKLEKLTCGGGFNDKPVEELGDLTVKLRSTRGELEMVGGELDGLEDGMVHLVRDRNDFVAYLRNIEPTHRSLTLKNL